MHTMKLIKPAVVSILLIVSSSSIAADGVINVFSNHSVDKTAMKLKTILSKKGMTIFNTVKHSESASKVGVDINPTQLVIFGNPKIGSPLMKCSQTVGIDLPQKALVWQDTMKKVWITYNNPSYLKQRHNIKGCDQVLMKVTGALKKITAAAAAQ